MIFHTSELVSSRYLYRSCSYVTTLKVIEKQNYDVSFVKSIDYFS